MSDKTTDEDKQTVSLRKNLELATKNRLIEQMIVTLKMLKTYTAENKLLNEQLIERAEAETKRIHRRPFNILAIAFVASFFWSSVLVIVLKVNSIF